MNRASLQSMAVAAIGLMGCGEDPQQSSRYAGELGASCESKADCQGSLLCTAQLTEDAHALRFCYTPCGEDGACPEGSFCSEDAVGSTAGQPVSTCVRRC